MIKKYILCLLFASGALLAMQPEGKQNKLLWQLEQLKQTAKKEGFSNLMPLLNQVEEEYKAEIRERAPRRRRPGIGGPLIDLSSLGEDLDVEPMGHED